MKRNLPKSFQDFIHFMIAGGLARLLPFLLLPYVAKVLTTEDFGLFSLYRLYIGLGSVFFLLGIEQGLFRLIPEIASEQRLRFLSNAIFFTLFVIFFFSLLSWPWHEDLNQFLLTSNLPFPFLILPLLILANGLTIILLTYFSAQQQSKKYLVGNLIVQGSFFLLFLAGLQMGWQLAAFFLAFLLANFFLLVANAKLFFSVFTIAPDLNILKRLLRTGFPLMLLLLITYLLYQSDHYIIKFYLGVEQTGLYNYGYRFASMLLIFVMQSNNVWFPRVYAKGENFFKQHFSNYASLMALGCAGILWGVFLLFHFFPSLLIPKGFEISKQILLIVGMGYLVYGQAQMMDAWLILKHKSSVLVLISIIALFFNILFNLLLIPRFGLWAAAWITTISFTFIWLAILINLKSLLTRRILFNSFLKTILFLLPLFWTFLSESLLIPFFTFVILAGYELFKNPLVNLRQN